MISQRWLIVCGAMCSAGLAWSAVLGLALLGGVRLVPTGIAVGVAALCTLPGVIAGVAGNRWFYRTTRPRRAWALTSWVPPHVPHWAGALAATMFFGFWLVVVLAFAGLDGSAEMRDGQWVLTDGARTTVLTEADQERRNSHEQQISLGILGALAVGGTFMTGAVLTHHNAPQVTETQSAGLPLA